MLNGVEEEQPRCWGSIIAGGDGCSPDFAPGMNHLKNKFCARCRSGGVLVPAIRLKVLQAEEHDKWKNTNASGVWSGAGYRLINQTVRCSGPRLVVFPHSLPADVEAGGPLPEEWLISRPGCPPSVHLVVSKGTLVPLEVPASIALRSSAPYQLPADWVAAASGGATEQQRVQPSEGAAADMIEDMDYNDEMLAFARSEPLGELDALLLVEQFPELTQQDHADGASAGPQLRPPAPAGAADHDEGVASDVATGPTGPAQRELLGDVPARSGQQQQQCLAQPKRGRPEADMDARCENDGDGGRVARVRLDEARSQTVEHVGVQLHSDRLGQYLQQQQSMCALIEGWLSDEAALPAEQIEALRSQLAAGRAILDRARSGELYASWKDTAAMKQKQPAIADPATAQPASARKAPAAEDPALQVAELQELASIALASDTPDTLAHLRAHVGEAALRRIYNSFCRLMGERLAASGLATEAEIAHLSAGETDGQCWRLLMESEPEGFVALFSAMQTFASLPTPGSLPWLHEPPSPSLLAFSALSACLSTGASLTIPSATRPDGDGRTEGRGLEGVGLDAMGTLEPVAASAASDSGEDLVRQLARLQLARADDNAIDGTTPAGDEAFDTMAFAELFGHALGQRSTTPPAGGDGDGPGPWRLITRVDGSHACEEMSLLPTDLSDSVRARLAPLLSSSRRLVLFKCSMTVAAPAYTAARNYQRSCEHGCLIRSFGPEDTLRDWTRLPMEPNASVSAMTGRAFLKAMAWIWSSLSGRIVYRTARHCIDEDAGAASSAVGVTRYAQLSVRYDPDKLEPDWTHPHVTFTLIRPCVPASTSSSSSSSSEGECSLLESIEVQREGVMSRLQSFYVANGPMANIRRDLERQQ